MIGVGDGCVVWCDDDDGGSVVVGGDDIDEASRWQTKIVWREKVHATKLHR
uniref:Uncharacterized protein n=1 Tax=Helianthus annuus TaxID=4232 RepID=A0A251SNV4_HELAN